MGMYDYIRCERELPVGGFESRVFQTKDTPSQYLENYVIKADGSLWHEECDYEDHSEPKAEPVPPFTGEIRFYDFYSGTGGWIEFAAYYIAGALQSLVCVRNEPAELPAQDTAA